MDALPDRAVTREEVIVMADAAACHDHMRTATTAFIVSL
jgi:hypothetical protein